MGRKRGPVGTIKKELLMSTGTLTLHRFNGDEVFNVSDATISYFVAESHIILQFDVKTEDVPVQTLPDTEELNGRPNGAWQLTVSAFDPDDLVGKTFLVPQGYDEDTEEYLAIFYYVEHEAVDNSEIVITGRDKDKYQATIISTVPDVNYYDGSKPATKIVIQAGFTLSRSEEPLDPVG